VFTNGVSYKIKAIVVNQVDVETESTLYSFSVSYSAPNTTIIPVTTVLCDESAIQIDWYEPVQSNGVVTGTSAYVDDFLITGNHGLELGDSNSYIEFDIETNTDFIAKLVYQPAVGFASGVMVELYDNDDDITYSVGYDGKRFYFENGNIIIGGTPMSLPTSPFLICIRSQDVVIVKDNAVMDWLKGGMVTVK
jgi:hypothetical protein